MGSIRERRTLECLAALAAVLLGGAACFGPEADVAPEAGVAPWTGAVSAPPASAASSIDRQRSFIRKQELQSRQRELEDRWHTGNVDRAGRTRDPRDPRQDFDQRGTFDALQRNRSGLEQLQRQR